MKYLLHTFFFGYAKLQWRRLIRTLVLIGLIVSGLMTDEPRQSLFVIAILAYALSLLSWIIKPFINKDEQPRGLMDAIMVVVYPLLVGLVVLLILKGPSFYKSPRSNIANVITSKAAITIEAALTDIDHELVDEDVVNKILEMYPEDPRAYRVAADYRSYIEDDYESGISFATKAINMGSDFAPEIYFERAHYKAMSGANASASKDYYLVVNLFDSLLRTEDSISVQWLYQRSLANLYAIKHDPNYFRYLEAANTNYPAYPVRIFETYLRIYNDLNHALNVVDENERYTIAGLETKWYLKNRIKHRLLDNFRWLIDTGYNRRKYIWKENTAITAFIRANPSIFEDICSLADEFANEGMSEALKFSKRYCQ